MTVNRSLAALLVAAVLLPLSARPVAAADGNVPGWYFEGDLGGVWTTGNSESSSLGASAELRRLWPDFSLRLSGVASQTQTTRVTRTAVGTGQDDFEVDEEKDTEKTAEFYNLTLIGHYDINQYFFLLGGVDWMRNRPAGIDSRTLLAAGAGNTWSDTETTRLSTYYNFTYTFEDDVIEDTITNKSTDFPGLQAGYGLEQKLTGTARLVSALVADWNLDNTDDVRINWYNGLPVSLNSRMEIKPGLRLMWRNDPALEELTLFDNGGNETGNVLVPLDELDTIFTLALVINFEPEAAE